MEIQIENQIKLQIPITTDEKPYIEFRIDKKGRIELSTTSSWWGGKNSGFISSDGSEGNSCKPKHLAVYINAYKDRKIKNIEKEILSLEKQLKLVKTQTEKWYF